MTARIVIHPPAGTGGRRVHIDGTILGLARSDMDVVEFLRRAGLPDAEPLLDDSRVGGMARGPAPRLRRAKHQQRLTSPVPDAAADARPASDQGSVSR